MGRRYKILLHSGTLSRLRRRAIANQRCLPSAVRRAGRFMVAGYVSAVDDFKSLHHAAHVRSGRAFHCVSYPNIRNGNLRPLRHRLGLARYWLQPDNVNLPAGRHVGFKSSIVSGCRNVSRIGSPASTGGRNDNRNRPDASDLDSLVVSPDCTVTKAFLTGCCLFGSASASRTAPVTSATRSVRTMR